MLLGHLGHILQKFHSIPTLDDSFAKHRKKNHHSIITYSSDSRMQNKFQTHVGWKWIMSGKSFY